MNFKVLKKNGNIFILGLLLLIVSIEGCKKEEVEPTLFTLKITSVSGLSFNYFDTLSIVLNKEMRNNEIIRISLGSNIFNVSGTPGYLVKLAIPYGITPGELTLKAVKNNESATYAERIQIVEDKKQPIIIDFYPKKLFIPGYITISGENFAPISSFNSILGISGSLISSTINTIVYRVDSNFDGRIKLAVLDIANSSTSTSKFVAYSEYYKLSASELIPGIDYKVVSNSSRPVTKLRFNNITIPKSSDWQISSTETEHNFVIPGNIPAGYYKPEFLNSSNSVIGVNIGDDSIYVKNCQTTFHFDSVRIKNNTYIKVNIYKDPAPVIDNGNLAFYYNKFFIKIGTTVFEYNTFASGDFSNFSNGNYTLNLQISLPQTGNFEIQCGLLPVRQDYNGAIYFQPAFGRRNLEIY